MDLDAKSQRRSCVPRQARDWIRVPRCAAGLLLFAGLAGCTGTDGQIVALPSPGHPTIDQVLRTDPRFSDFTQLIDFAGLSHELDDAKNMTVFAPTNAAFARSDPSWRTFAVPDGNATGGADYFKRQKLLEEAGIFGVHPPSEFAGKLQDVRSLSGMVFHVDGRKAGVITISTGPVIETGIGFSKSATLYAELQLPPLQTAGGLIYPVDGIVVPLTSLK